MLVGDTEAEGVAVKEKAAVGDDESNAEVVSVTESLGVALSVPVTD